MNDLSNRGPLSLKGDKPPKSPARGLPPVSAKKREYRKSEAGREGSAYLRAVRDLPCCICLEYGMRQLSPTQAHHCIHGRHGTRKVPDKMSLPLCEGHHQGLIDTTKIAVHREPDKWKAAYGADTDWISWTEERVKL